MIEGIIPAEIAEEPAAIRETLAGSADAAHLAASALLRQGVTRIHVIGNGTSYHSSLAAATLYRRHALPSDPTVVAITAGEFRSYLPVLGPTDAVIGISASGEFRDVVAVVEALRGRVPTVAIVHVPGSTLDRTADHVVRSAGGPSRVPVMTKTFAATLVAADLVLAELLGGERAERCGENDEERAHAEEPRRGQHHRDEARHHVPHDLRRRIRRLDVRRRGDDQRRRERPRVHAAPASARFSAVLLAWKSCDSGMFDGQTYAHEPQSMQSARCRSAISSYRCTRA
jgi:Glucosamine 6-phosphate synthetase, contains amidotransferase and phosphosugar isomerase domains